MKIHSVKTIVLSALTLFLVFAFVRPKPEQALRVMSYNIRNAKGLDNVTDYARIAAIIVREAPDVVALQEIDSVTRRSGGVDVLGQLASLTGMHAVYGASITFDGGKYGIGVLSREKPLSWRRIPLPGREEARSLLLVEFADYVFCCTHFSLTPDDRLASVAVIDQAVKNSLKPVLLAGDINAQPDSPVLTAFAANWKTLTNSRKKTFPANKPSVTIDYIFGYNPQQFNYSVKKSKVVDEPVASDHRPIVVNIRITSYPRVAESIVMVSPDLSQVQAIVPEPLVFVPTARVVQGGEGSSWSAGGEARTSLAARKRSFEQPVVRRIAAMRFKIITNQVFERLRRLNV